MNKKKLLKIVLWLSFVPYLFLIGYSLYKAIFGHNVYTLILPQYLRTTYGWEAFLEVFVWNGIALCVIPVLPICFLYQIIYLIYSIIILILKVFVNKYILKIYIFLLM